MQPRRLIAIGAAVVIVGAGVTIGVLNRSDATTTTKPARQSTTLQPVEQRTLETTQDVSGTVGFSAATTIRIGSGGSSTGTASASASGGAGAGAGAASSSSSASSSGTITALPAVGSVIDVGGSLAEVDGSPSVFLMVGTRPMWRTLTTGISDGPDVLQLEQTLAVLGYGADFTTDSTFTSGTASAIRAFQEAKGVTVTGSFTPSEIVFAPGPIRVASLLATVGGSASGDLLTATGNAPVIHVDLDASLVASANAGDTVKVELPDGTTVDGIIYGVGAATSTTSSAQGNQQGSTTTTVSVDIVVTGTDIAKYDGASVVVHLVTAKAANALSVPVKSLVALAEGGFAVERVRGGQHQLVKVTPGTFAGGFVEVSGDVKVGDRVVTP
ncbi:MAG: peptidoglycan-binding protein [Acidimicrobiia bacterium]|nr:peptidoglycan-binding protein [Acidimicrobiia bacterium]